MTFSLATWNINSVRLRMPIVERVLAEKQPDVLCLQEIKCVNDAFPVKALRKAGYEYHAVHGQKGYHGVAIVSKHPLREISSTDYVAMGDTRHVTAIVETGLGPVRVHNFYVPAGGDTPDRKTNPKFDHKLKFLNEMHALDAEEGAVPSILVGDLNIAPLETDVWSHKQLLKVVSHTPIETETLNAVQASGGWEDVLRRHVDPAEKLYTWWSYRNPNWATNNKGRRLDHIWAAPRLAERSTGIEVMKDARSWEKPSDHVPVIATFDI